MQDADNHAKLLAAMRWQVEAGADEVVSDTPYQLAEGHLRGGAPRDAVEPPNAVERFEGRVASQSVPQLAPEVPVAEMPASKVAPQVLPDFSACASLEELRVAVAGFDLDLKATATQMVFADGDPTSKIMFIGEAPGGDEDRQGRPFVGVSGKLFNKMLESIGLVRERIYITNTILWRPPGNRTPTEEEVAVFLPILRRHIALVAPEILVCLGGAAAKALLATDMGILKLRGKWHDYDMGGDMGGTIVPLLPTLHPAYLLRMPEQKTLAWRDFCLIAQKMREKSI